jgi:hypothetical protein
MGERAKINVWYDKEGDFLDVGWGGSTSTVPTQDDRVMAHVDDAGNIQGFHIIGVRSFEGNYIDVDLEPIDAESTTQR